MAYIQKKLKMMRVISSFADGPVNFHSTGPPEDQIQKLISSTGKARKSWNLDGWSFFFCLVSMNEFWMCLFYYIYASGQGLFRDTRLNLVERFRKRTCRLRSDFNNKIHHPLLVLSFVNTNWLPVKQRDTLRWPSLTFTRPNKIFSRK